MVPCMYFEAISHYPSVSLFNGMMTMRPCVPCFFRRPSSISVKQYKTKNKACNPAMFPSQPDHPCQDLPPLLPRREREREREEKPIAFQVFTQSLRVGYLRAQVRSNTVTGLGGWNSANGLVIKLLRTRLLCPFDHCCHRSPSCCSAWWGAMSSKESEIDDRFNGLGRRNRGPGWCINVPCSPGIE